MEALTGLSIVIIIAIMPPVVIVRSMITATKAGIKVEQNKLEAHYLAGGNVVKVINALVSADKANLGLSRNH